MTRLSSGLSAQITDSEEESADEIKPVLTDQEISEKLKVLSGSKLGLD